MKICSVEGDLSSDSGAEQYPDVSLCDSCIAKDGRYYDTYGMSRIFQVEAYDPAYGSCEWCNKTAQQEADEKAEDDGWALYE